MNVVLFGGPFDGESRNVAVDNVGNPPDEVKLLDSISTMAAVIETTVGEAVPIEYQVYTRHECSGAGIWRYQYKGVYRGHLAIES